MEFIARVMITKKGQWFQVQLHFYFNYEQEDKEKNGCSFKNAIIQLFPSNDKLY